MIGESASRVRKWIVLFVSEREKERERERERARDFLVEQIFRESHLNDDFL
jgi:hypothetical protein